MLPEANVGPVSLPRPSGDSPQGSGSTGPSGDETFIIRRVLEDAGVLSENDRDMLLVEMRGYERGRVAR